MRPGFDSFQYEMLAHNREEGSKSVFIGGAVYPTLAMFNHSCDPSIVRYYKLNYDKAA